MSQYNEKVALQRQILKAEEYVNQPTCIHAHRLTSMWYDNDQTVKEWAKENGYSTRKKRKIK